MALIDPICSLFCITNGPDYGHDRPQKGPQTTPKTDFCLQNQRDKHKNRAKCPLFNDFPVPLNAWDKPGTRLGQGTSGTRAISRGFAVARDLSANFKMYPDVCILHRLFGRDGQADAALFAFAFVDTAWRSRSGQKIRADRGIEQA